MRLEPVRSKFLWIIPLLLLFVLALPAGAFFLADRFHYPVSFAAKDFAKDDRHLRNPYIGWYQLYGYTLGAQEGFQPQEMANSLSTDRENRLALLQINLRQFQEADLDTPALQELGELLSFWATTDKSLILRFLYDWDGQATATEPRNLQQILRHMKQIAPVVNAHKEHIYIVQGLFVGNWGEMHGSVHLSPDSLRTLAATLGQNLDPSILLAVRTPALYRLVTQSGEALTAEQAYQADLQSRVSLYNDGMMASETDYGTYSEEALTASSPLESEGNRDQELAFQNIQNLYLPLGGETVKDNAYNDPKQALPYLETVRASYLNEEYDLAVLDKWKNSPSDADMGQGKSGSFYDLVQSRLGYRYFLEQARLESHGFFSSQANLRLQVKNLGFANAYRRFDCFLLLRRLGDAPRIPGRNNDSSGGSPICLPIDTDNRFWHPGSAVELTAQLPLPYLAGGQYEMYLVLRDMPHGENIRFANTEDAAYGCPIGSLIVEENALLAKAKAAWSALRRK